MAETKNLKNCLSEEKIFVKYIMDYSNTIEDKKHPLYGGLSSNAYIGISAPITTKRISQIFTKEELEFLGNELNEDLSPNSKFWKEYGKDDTGTPYGVFPIFLKKEGSILNKNNAIDYIKIKILQDSDLIANTQDEINQKKGVRFVLISEKDMYKKETTSRNVKKEAFKLYDKYEDDLEVLTYVLKSFNKSVDSRHKKDFIQKEAWAVMEANPQAFIVTTSDENLRTKIKINDFINCKLIVRSNNLYYDIEGKALALDGEVNDLTGCSRYLDSGIGGEFRLELEAKVKAIQKK